MRAEPHANWIAIAAQNVNDTVGDSRFSQQRSKPQGSSRRQFARLNDASATCSQGKGQLLAHDQQWKIPRSYHADHAYRLANNQAKHLFSQRVVGVTGEIAARSGRVIPNTGRPFHLIPGLRDLFSAFQCFDQCQFVRVFTNQQSQFCKTGGSFSAGTLWPRSLIKCASGSSYREISFFVARQGINANYHVMSWTPAIKGFSRLVFFSVDPKLVLKWFCRKLVHRP